MALDIFASFDEQNKITFDVYYLIWLVVPMALILKCSFFAYKSYINSSYFLANKTAHSLAQATAQAEALGGFLLIISIFLMNISIVNFVGLIPHFFSASSHLAYNFTLALPLWISAFILSGSFNIRSFFSHFLPLGTPIYLIPFLILIELVSMLVRPFTLMVRLCANMSAGHILMGLLGNMIPEATLFSSPLIYILGALYFMFEMAVCFVQAYIFVMLSTMYLDEHPSSS